MKNILSKAHRLVLRYALFASPIILFYIYWYSIHDYQPQGKWLDKLNGFAFAWILSLGYSVTALLFDRNLREKILTRLAGFREGDEREALVTARASRSTFLLTLAVQIVLLIMSVTNVSLIWNPRPTQPDTHGLFTVGMNVNPSHLDVFPGPEAHVKPMSKDEESFPGEVLFRGTLMPPNLALILLLLIVLQVGGFQFFARRRYDGLEE